MHAPWQFRVPDDVVEAGDFRGTTSGVRGRGRGDPQCQAARTTWRPAEETSSGLSGSSPSCCRRRRCRQRASSFGGGRRRRQIEKKLLPRAEFHLLACGQCLSWGLPGVLSSPTRYHTSWRRRLYIDLSAYIWKLLLPRRVRAAPLWRTEMSCRTADTSTAVPCRNRNCIDSAQGRGASSFFLLFFFFFLCI
jgi:hypothetical protein